LARAKNTSRAEARKRTRDVQRAELEDDEQLEDEPETAAPAARPALFQIPKIRDDISALPAMFRTRRLLWLPFGLLIVGFFLALGIYGIPADLQPLVALYLQFFFVPEGLFIYFIAGFLAPRGSYLVGLMIGALSGVLYSIAILVTLPAGSDPSVVTEAQAVAVRSLIYGPVLGMFAGGFAAWYRNFLRNMQESGNKRRADKEAQGRAKRRDERQEARRVAKQRPS